MHYALNVHLVHFVYVLEMINHTVKPTITAKHFCECYSYTHNAVSVSVKIKCHLYTLP